MTRYSLLLILLVLPTLLLAGGAETGVSTVDDLLSQAVGITIDSPGPLRIRHTRPRPTIYILSNDGCALVSTERTADERPMKYAWVISRLDGLPAASLLGDVDGNGRVDMGDVIGLINFIFSEGSFPSCIECGDVAGDSRIDTADVVALLDYLFPSTRESR